MPPRLIGVLVGGSLVARELEYGTWRLAWSQTVPRTRWLGVKLALVTGGLIAVGAAMTAVITWYRAPMDRVVGHLGIGVVPPDTSHIGDLVLSMNGNLVTYQPASRFWPFQFIEAGIFVALTAAALAPPSGCCTGAPPGPPDLPTAPLQLLALSILLAAATVWLVRRHAENRARRSRTETRAAADSRHQRPPRGGGTAAGRG